MLAMFFILIVFTESTQAYIDMATSFYEESRVKYLCLLTCDTSNTLAKHASELNIVVSMVDINFFGEDFSKFEACMTQRVSMGVLVDENCKSFEKVMNYASKNMMLDSRHKWLIISSNTDRTIREKTKSNIYNTNYKDVIIKTDTVTTKDRVEEEENGNNDTEISDSPFNLTDYIYNETDFNDKCNKTENANEAGNVKDLGLVNDDMTRREKFEERKIFRILKNLNLSVDADITYADLTDDTFELYEIYNFGKIQGGSLVIKKTGSCSTSELSLPFNSSYVYYRRWNFEEMNMRVMVVMSPVPEVFDPEFVLGRVRDPRTPFVIQTGAQIVHVLSEIHNIKFVYTPVVRWVGDFQRNSTYTATNALFFRETDITPVLRFGPKFFGRLDVVSTSLTNIETKFYYRIPSSGPGKFENQFLTPLTTGAWWGVVGVCMICGVVLLTSSIFEGRPMSLLYAIFSVFALVCQQSRKITILVTGMSCVLLYNYYTSSVVSWLLSGPPPSINSLLELINSPLQAVFEDIGYTQSWLQLPDFYYNKRNSEDEDKLKKKMFKQMKKMSIFRSLDEGIELVKRGGYAYHTEANGANERISRTFDQRELCDMGSLQVMEKTSLFPAIQKNSPYKEFFNWSMMKLKERGIVSCVRRRLSTQESSCEGSSPRALALGGAAPAFILLAAGYVLGIIVMMIERWRHKSARSRPIITDRFFVGKK